MNDSAHPASTTLLPTPLHALHQRLGAKLVGFAGYAMPLQYAGGIKQEHLHTRAAAGLFDVSHMGQIIISGAVDDLEEVVPGEIAALDAYRQRYTLMTNAHGGIVDDLMVTRLPGRLLVVANAAFKQQVLATLREILGARCAIELAADRALLALQGPAAATVLAALVPAVRDLPFMAALECSIDGVPCLVSRAGYTGEDGFEIALPGAHASALAERLLADPQVAPVGLGARDTLRLEAGLCLSGTDIGPDTTPVAAALAWTIAKKYRDGSAAARFPGAARILAELASGAARVRVGFAPAGRIPVRGGTAVHGDDGREVGTITSGTFAASVDRPIAMGYVERTLASPGTRLAVTIRGRVHVITVVTLPFVPHHYHRP